MAVPGRRNGMMGDDDDDAAATLEFYEPDADSGSDSDIPPHLRDLSDACRTGDIQALTLALDNLGGSIDEPIEDGDTALHLACLYGNLASVQLLLERGANMEVKDEEGAIPLHDASAGGYTDIVEVLINNARDAACVKRMLESVDIEGDTPLHHAARGEHVNVIQFLLSAGASPTKTNIYGKNASALADPDTEAKRVLEVAANAVASH